MNKACAVEQDIDPLKSVDERVDRSDVSHIDDSGLDARQCGECRLVDIQCQDAGAGGCKTLGGGTANTLARGGYDGDFAVE